jgi:hypothetical protein
MPDSDLGALSDSLAKVTTDLQQWSNQHFCNVTKRIKELKNKGDGGARMC